MTSWGGFIADTLLKISTETAIVRMMKKCLYKTNMKALCKMKRCC